MILTGITPSAWRSLKALLVAVGLSTVLAAQQAPSDDPALVLRSDAQRRAEWAEQWLRSDDPARVAWGAWLARVDRIRPLIPLLTQQVEHYQSSEEYSAGPVADDRHDALLVVLDALISLEVVIAADEAHKLYAEFPAQSLILLLRSQNNAPALLDIFEKAKGNANWLAAGNALAKTRSPGFAFALLNRLTVHLSVSVVSPAAGVGGGSGGGSTEYDFAQGAMKPDWPHVGLYELTQFPDYRIPAAKAVLLVNGETPVYYQRSESGNYNGRPDVPVCYDGNRDEYRAQYLNGLFKPLDAQVKAYPYAAIEWRDDLGYRRDLQQIVEQQKTKFFVIVTSLLQAGALSTEEAKALRLRSEIVIQDNRLKPASPLPELSEPELTLPVRSAFNPPLD